MLVRTVVAHTGYVETLAVNTNNIISGSDDSIKVWDLQNGDCLRTIDTENVCSLELTDHGRFVSCTNHSIDVWDLQNDDFKLQLQNDDEVHHRTMIVDEGSVYTGEKGGEINVWDLENGKCFRSFPQGPMYGDSISISSLAIKDGLLVSGSWDHTAKVWGLGGTGFRFILTGHTSHVYSVVISGNHIISGSHDGTIKIWDLKRGDCLRTLEGHTDSVTILKVRENRLVSGSWDNTVKVWDLESGECLHTLEGHTDSVLSLGMVDDLVISGSKDGTIKIWKC